MTKPGFGIWLTGIPASGKSSIARALVRRFEAQGILVVVLESDEMRKILTPQPTYSTGERDRFYHMLALLGEVITKSGVNVIFDATANRRSYRDEARRRISRFIEVYVTCPLDVCRTRDPKGIYAQASAGTATTVPGLQEVYEPPLHPEVTIDGRQPPDAGAEVVMRRLAEMGAI